MKKKGEKEQKCMGKGMFYYFIFFWGVSIEFWMRTQKVINDAYNNTNLHFINNLITTHNGISSSQNIFMVKYANISYLK